MRTFRKTMTAYGKYKQTAVINKPQGYDRQIHNASYGLTYCYEAI